MAELSRIAEVPIATIKFYVREGILPPGERVKPNQARYGERHIRRLKVIRALLEVGGLPLAAVKEVVSSATPWAERTVEDLAERHVFPAKPGSAPELALAAILARLRELGRDDVLAALDDYAAAMRRVAEIDVSLAHSSPDTVLSDALLSTLRKLAVQQVSARRSA
ncbi:MerR family transcriptional regulator [Amycolatopsis sp. cg5]|uniref:MerR family transcriptional regulator n=1 Tax=Amycolatopsis sp. cg5 TaxID=3238802 RepID=UPI003526AECF